MDAVGPLKLDGEAQMFNIVTIDVTGRAGEVEIRRKPALRLMKIGCPVAGAHFLGVDRFGIIDVWQDIFANVGGGRKRESRRFADSRCRGIGDPSFDWLLMLSQRYPQVEPSQKKERYESEQCHDGKNQVELLSMAFCWQSNSAA